MHEAKVRAASTKTGAFTRTMDCRGVPVSSRWATQSPRVGASKMTKDGSTVEARSLDAESAAVARGNYPVLLFARTPGNGQRVWPAVGKKGGETVRPTSLALLHAGLNGRSQS